MNRKWLVMMVAGAMGAGAAASASAQAYLDQETIRITRAPDVAGADGVCHLRVWVDDRARIQLRGDQLVVRTEAGRRSFDEGSVCNQPLPLRPVDDFRVVAERARGDVLGVDRPDGGNDFTGSVAIEDPQDGGDLYDITLAWRNPAVIVAPVAAAPVYAPGYDHTRACQAQVRADFLARNAGDAYLEFTGTAVRDAMGPRRDRIRGDAWARNRIESRLISYECVVNERNDRVLSATYEVLPRARYSSLY